MSYNDCEDPRIDEILKKIEFPGEHEAQIKDYLHGDRLSDLIMKKVIARHEAVNRAIFWAVFALLNLILLSIVSTNQFIVQEYFAFQSTLAFFFFIFLGLSFCGSVFGLVLTADTSWINHDNYRKAVTFMTGLPKWIRGKFFR